MRKGTILLLPVISAFLISISFPSFNLGIFAWIGLSPFLCVLHKRSVIGSIGIAFLFGLFFGVGSFSWVLNIEVFNLFKFLICLLLFSIYFVIFGILYRLINNTVGNWIIVVAPALWVVLEYIRSNLFFLSFPFNLLGHSQYQFPYIIQIADITGVYGISFLIVMINQLLSQLMVALFMDRSKSSSFSESIYNINWNIHLLIAGIAIAVAMSYGLYKMNVKEDGLHIRLAIIQANVLTKDKMSIDEQISHLRIYEKFTNEAAIQRPDLIVWPASSLPAPLRTKYTNIIIRRLANGAGTYLLVGGAGGAKYSPRKIGELPYSNTEFLISPTGSVEGQYNKIHLLPFNEYLPLSGFIRWPQWIASRIDSFQKGSEYKIFQVSGARFGTPICWENMFPDIFRRFVKNGAQFMVSVTNEGFFGLSAAPYQTLAINIFRAVENRVAIARAAPTGISAFINAKGEIIERIMDDSGKDIFVSGIIVSEITLSNKKSFYTVYGDVFVYILAAMSLLIVITSIYLQKNSTYLVET